MLSPFVSELARDWARDDSAPATRRLHGTLVFADISGFTRLTERLAAKGRFGAEEMSDHLDLVLSELLEAAYAHGGWLVKWGGDALLVMYDGPDHVRRACAASAAMRTSMGRVGVLDTSVGRVRLRMSIGVHTGGFDFAFLGPVHRELLITGGAATVTARLEATAEAGEILLSPRTAAELPEACRGRPKGDGILLARAPDCPPPDPVPPRLDDDVKGLLPELVFEHLAAGGGNGEHRQVAVGFLEFSGMARVRRKAGADGLLAALDHVVALTQAVCHRYTVSFHETDIAPDGGKIMLVAGAPRGVDDPAEAMLCALRQVLDDPGALSLRAGVTVGRVFTGAVGPAFRRSYSVKGDVVNLAARIMGKTPPGCLWTLPAVTDASRTSFTLEAVTPFLVKGKTAPVTAVAVGPPSVRAGTTADLPLIGRDAEFGVLDAALTRARTGSGSCLEILGGAGTGKTRLLSETIRAAGDMRVLSAAGEPFRTASPYAVVRSLLLDATGMTEQPLATMPEAIRAWTRERQPDLEVWLPLLGTVLQTSFPPTPQTEDLATEFRGERLRALILEVLAAALPGPSLLVVDDMQFADPASADALALVAQGVANRPWLLVLASRDEAPREGEQPDRPDRIVLHPLTAETATVLVYADTDEAPLTPHVLTAVVERGGGNPLFLRQLARAARDVTNAADLPDSIETVVTVQIDRLPPTAREVLRAAAVLGMHVHRGVLAELLAADGETEPIDATIGRLAEFLTPVGSGLRFRQAVVRDAAYDGLPYRRRNALHARLARLLDERAGTSDAGAAVRSLHHFQAGNDRAALRLSRVAADRASAAYANVEAAVLYRRSLESARRLRDDVTPAERAELLERLGDVQLRLGEYRDSDASYSTARRLIQDNAMLVARIGMKTARSASQRGDYALTLRRLHRVERLLAPVSDPAAEGIRLDARMRAAFTQFRQGRLTLARASCRDILADADEDTHPDVVADALGVLDVVEMSLGLGSDGERSRRALRLFRRLAGLAGQARMHNQLGYSAYFDGRWDDAVSSYRQAEQLYQRLGDLPNAAVNDANVAEILVDQGRLDEAEVALQRALRIWRASGADNDAAFGLALLGRVHARQGRYDEAERLLDDARRRFSEQGARAEVVDADAYLAECLLLRGQAAEALSKAEATLAAAVRLSDQPAQAPLLYRIVAGSHDALGDDDAADLAYSRALELARRRKADHELAFTVAAMAARARRTGTPVDPELIRETIPLQQRLGVLVSDLDADLPHH
jgi:class 3 adenylate cyclase/tetratricopeptide (TPR) repeat protein